LIELLLTAIGLGIAGLDPIGALVAIGALGSGVRERFVIAYGLIGIVGTAALGTVLSLLVGTRLAEIDWSFLDSGDRFWAIGEAVVGAGLLAWAVRRIFRPAASDAEPKKHSAGEIALIATSVVFIISAVLDPTFVGLVMLAGRDGQVLDASLAHLAWILVSQSPLVLVTGAIATGKHGSFVVQFQKWWGKIRPAVAWVGTALAFVAGAVLLVDAGWWFFTDQFLLDF
jgi:hypothetical protein